MTQKILPHPSNFVIMAVLMGAHFGAAAVFRANIILNKSTVFEGDSVMIRCEIWNQEISRVMAICQKRTLDPSHLIDPYHMEATGRDPQNIQPVEIATNHFANTEFSQTGRYSGNHEVDQTEAGKKLSYIINISNVSTEEVGLYSCKFAFEEQTMETRKELLMVVAPIEHVGWSMYNQSTKSWSPLSPNETLNVDEMEELKIRCESSGGYPVPTYSILSRDNSGIRETLNLTSKFQKKVNLTSKNKPSKFLEKIFLSTTLSPSPEDDDIKEEMQDKDEEKEDQKEDKDEEEDEDEEGEEQKEQKKKKKEEEEKGNEYEEKVWGMRATYSLNEKSLVCSVTIDKHPDGELMSMEAEVFVVLNQFRPQFLCSNQIKVQQNAKNFNLTCDIIARPGVKDIQIFVNGSVPIKHRNGQYMADTQVVNGTDDERVRSTLTIFRVSLMHFSKYEFVATNDLGNTTHVVELIRDNNNQRTLSQKSGIASSSNGALPLVATLVATSAMTLATLGY